MPKLSCAQLRDHLVLRHNHLSSRSGFVLTMLCILMIRIRRYLFSYFTWKTLSNHAFWGPSEAEGPQHPILILRLGFNLRCFRSWPSNDYLMATTIHRMVNLLRPILIGRMPVQFHPSLTWAASFGSCGRELSIPLRRNRFTKESP
jgi:hypothetical protein